MMVLTHTFTRTYNVITPASPYLRCLGCSARVEYFLDAERPTNKPCGHHAGFESTCPSWGPVDGCECAQHLGHVPHSMPTAAQTEYGSEQGPL